MFTRNLTLTLKIHEANASTILLQRNKTEMAQKKLKGIIIKKMKCEQNNHTFCLFPII